MAGVNLFRVLYHFENGGKVSSDQRIDRVIAADGKEATIKAVLASNTRTLSGSTVVIDSVHNERPTGDVIS